MKLSHVLALALVAVLGAGLAVAAKAETIKSGPQVGEDLAGPFHPLNVTGEKAGEKNCLYCSNGGNPVAMIFARSVSDDLGKLCKQIESCCDKNAGCKMGSFVVVCTEEEGTDAKLKQLAKDNDLKKVVLSIDNPAGPKGYKVNKDADITVVLYVDRNVKANFAYKKGEMKDKDIEEIVKAVPKILPSK
jgi:hypothetical protein